MSEILVHDTGFGEHGVSTESVLYTRKSDGVTGSYLKWTRGCAVCGTPITALTRHDFKDKEPVFFLKHCLKHSLGKDHWLKTVNERRRAKRVQPTTQPGCKVVA
jgi:hypothetical protein